MSNARPLAPGPSEPVDVENGIRELLARTDRNTSLSVGKIQTVGHLRRTARDIAGNLYGVHAETAEVVALQNAFERALNQFCEAMNTPSAALEYVAPDAARAQQTAQSLAARASSANGTDSQLPPTSVKNAVVVNDSSEPALTL